MDLFTIIFEFKGGTYTMQQTAQNHKEAFLNAIKSIKTTDVYGLGIKSKTELLNIDISNMVKLNNTTNVWYIAETIKTGFAEFYIIKTSL